MRLLIVRAQGGLCNRMRALLSAASYAEATDRRLLYAWVRSPDFEAGLDELWMNPYREIPSRMVSLVARAVGGYTLHSDIGLASTKRVIVTNSNEVIAGGDPGIVPWIDRLRALPLEPALHSRILRAISSWPAERPVVGVMIRSQRAHDETVDASPVNWFIDRMGAIRAAHRDVAFFLSADDPAVADRVRETFADVIQLDGKSAYNSAGGVADAVCDLYLLASANYLVGSHYSSFSHAAGALADHGGYETSRLAPTTDLATCLARPSVFIKTQGAKTPAASAEPGT